MNRPARIHFHDDSAPSLDQLPERYRDNVETSTRLGLMHYSLLVQNAFYVDYAPSIIRTRVGGRNEDPVDFQWDSVSHIEWFYSEDLPAPLEYEEAKPRRADRLNQSQDN